LRSEALSNGIVKVSSVPQAGRDGIVECGQTRSFGPAFS